MKTVRLTEYDASGNDAVRTYFSPETIAFIHPEGGCSTMIHFPCVYGLIRVKANKNCYHEDAASICCHCKNYNKSRGWCMNLGCKHAYNEDAERPCEFESREGFSI